MVVVDASALVDILLGRPLAAALQARLFRVTESLAAPYLIDLEVLQALRRWVLAGAIAVERAQNAVQNYLEIHVRRYPHDALLERVWELRNNFTAYDATYIALAEALNVPLITLDARLAKAAPPTVRVELFA